MNRETCNKFAEEYNIPLNEVADLYTEEEAKLIKTPMNPKAVKRVAWAVTQRKLLDKYGGAGEAIITTSEVTELEGYLIGAGEFRDRAQEMRSKAEKALEKDKGEAMAAGLVDREGRVLDSRDKIFGRANTKKGTPLDPDVKWLEMILYGAFRVVDTDDPFVYTRFQTSNNTLAEAWAKIGFPEHAFQPCRTHGKIKVDEYGYLIYGLTSSDSRTVFRGKGVEINVDSGVAVREALGQYTVDIAESYNGYLAWLPQTKDKKPDMGKRYTIWDAIMAVEGIITDIQWERRDFWKGIPAKMFDPDDVLSSISVYLPNTWNHNFGEYTMGIAYGRPDEVWVKGEGSDSYNTRSGVAEVRCMGFYPIPGMITESSQHTLDETQKEYVGFVG